MKYSKIEEVRVKLNDEKKLYNRIILWTTIVAVILFSLITYISIITNYIFLVLFSIIILFLYIFFVTKIVFKKIKLNAIYQNFIKKYVVDEELKKHYDEIIYERSNSISLNEILKSELIKEPDEFDGGEYLSGSYRGISFEASEVEFTDIRTTTNAESEEEEERDEYFDGLWFRFKLNKQLPGKIKILQEDLGVNLIGHARIETEMIIFNKLFSSFTTNKLFYFNVFKPTRIENLIKINKLYPHLMVCSFINDELHIGFNSSTVFLRINLKTVVNDSNLEEILRELLLPKQIIDLLDLPNIGDFT